MRPVRVSDNLYNELERIRKEIEKKEQRNTTFIATTERVSKILKKVKV